MRSLPASRPQPVLPGHGPAEAPQRRSGRISPIRIGVPIRVKTRMIERSNSKYRSAVDRDDLLEAVQSYRRATGAGLLDATADVQRIVRSLR
jgi:hypothetical protein